MFCPKCGTSNQKGKAYCARCGEALSGDAPQRHLLVMNIFSGLGSLVALASALLLYVTQLGRGPLHWAVSLAATFGLMLFSWQLTCFILGMILARRLRRAREGAGEEVGGRFVEGAATRRSLADASGAAVQFAAARSATEQTTELLEPAPPRRGREGGR
jgi:predicted nucleic acid-binding Zn ribbon protein